MLSSLTLLGALFVGGAPAVESTMLQVAPVPADGKWTRNPKHVQAIVLLHGFHYHFRDASVPKAEFRPWQKADSPLVKELAKTADVFAFAYGQNASLDTIVKESMLCTNIAQLRKLGYTEIVLVGHSAGGLIARHFVEDHPEAGVTKVVQVCAPNGGSPLAGFDVPKSQKVFVDCLTEKSRQESMIRRANKLIPKGVQFVCVVAKSKAGATDDGVVPCVCQWTADLRKQGVSAVSVVGAHRDIVRDAKHAAALADVIRGNHVRWPLDRIEKAREAILGK